MRFDGQVVIVTGAASGIGLATALRFGSEGAVVVLADRDAARLPAACAQVTQGSARAAETSMCDVGEEADVAATVAQAVDRHGRLDVVVNNAGMMIFKKIEDQTAEDWIGLLKVDLLGAFFFIKHAFRQMHQGGAIVNLSSVHAVETQPLVAPYAAAKAGLLSLTRSAAIEGAAKGIRVNAILPGAVDTPMLWDNPNVKAGLEHLDPHDVGTAADVAAAIAFLASADARFIQGASLRVDGGRLSKL